jgi:hypothetical protein
MRRRWLGAAFGVAASLAIALIGWQLRTPEPGTAEATITLLADRQRGGTSETVAVPRAAGTVRLQVEVDDANARYALEIEDAGRIVFDADDLAVRSADAYRFVETDVPKQVLAGGERTVRVRAPGVASAERWTLRIRDD